MLPYLAARLRQPATGSLTQIQEWNKSFRPCWRYVAFHDVPSWNQMRPILGRTHTEEGLLHFTGALRKEW